MLFLLSPAKSLDYERPVAMTAHTLPVFADQAAELIGVLKTKTPAEVASLMALSDALATLNVARYAAWSRRFTRRNSKPAVLAFDGDVYHGLDARTLEARDLAWAQRHLVILSGLYGVLRPLDWMQPYRLEMGTRLATGAAPDLYGYWGSLLSGYLNQRLAGQRSPTVVNLASEEYFKAVGGGALKARVVHCVFEDWKDGRYKVIGFHAKRARGMMARHAVRQRVRSVQGLQGFAAAGYRHEPQAGGPDRLVFRRRLETPATASE